MLLSINQILVICLICVLVAMLVVLIILAIKAIALMKSVSEFTDEYGKLASEAEVVLNDVKETVYEGAEIFNKSLTAIAVSSLAFNIYKKTKKFRKKRKKNNSRKG